MQKTMGSPIIDFHLSILAPISKWGCVTNDDDGYEWIMLQPCGDAKSQKVDLLQSGLIK